MLRIGIAGAGVLGRLLAWQLSRAGHAVTVFDPAAGPAAPATGSLTGNPAHAAGFTAAGMLSPIAELDNAGPEIARLGWRSLALWREVAEALRADGSKCGKRLGDTWEAAQMWGLGELRAEKAALMG